jgi:hypothetical protein
MKRIGTFLLMVVALFTTIRLMASCNLETRSGNGNVVKEVRKVSAFNGVEASSGINVFLFQSDEEKVVVEADENLMPLIRTEVRGNTLKCYIDGSIRRSKKLNVYVSFKELNKISASSGADLYSETVIRATDLSINASSGADIKLKVDAETIRCQSSSGSDIKLVGICNEFDGSASSGADIKADELTAKIAKANASSAGEIRIRVLEKISASASSGGDVTYYGNPKHVDIRESSGGDVSRR